MTAPSRSVRSTRALASARRPRTSVRGRPKELPNPTEIIANSGLADAISSGVVTLKLPGRPILIKFAIG